MHNMKHLWWLLMVSISFTSVHGDPFDRKRSQMVEVQIKQRGVEDKKTLEAMRMTPRHKFVPKHLISSAYADRPLPIGMGQTISQPYIVALMTEKLALAPNHRVLEVGTGSGYQAAVLSPICKEVYTVEIIPSLGEKARQRFDKLGYKNIRTKIADGFYGWKESAPYDAIVVTAAATQIPPPLIQQLKVGGRMVIPLGSVFQVQRLMVITKEPDGSITSENILPVRFVPLTGGHG